MKDWKEKASDINFAVLVIIVLGILIYHYYK